MDILDERFDAKWDYHAPWTCWIWRKRGNRYAKFWNGERNVLAHRWSYVRKYGPIPEGMVLDHFKCDNKLCVNPDHVRPVTNLNNIRRSLPTHCKNGHPFDEANTQWRADGTGRRCRTCNRVRR